MRNLIALLLLLCTGARVPVGPTPQEPGDVRFDRVDVFIDPGERALAAWQVELRDPSGRAKVVGVEGGDGDVWAAPPHYDPEALRGGRIVLAAFTLEGASAGRQRVARVHLAVTGTDPVEFEVELEAVADTDGRFEGAEVEVKE